MAFSDLLGQKELKERTATLIRNGRLSHAYIFSGPSGIGKRTFAREFAKEAACASPVDGRSCGKCKACILAASGNNTDIRIIASPDGKGPGVDTVRREICDDVARAPLFSSRKIYVIENGDGMNDSAQNALLKTLEEPPSYVMILILCGSVLPLLETIRSRSVVFELERYSDGEIIEAYERLKSRYEAEGKEFFEKDRELLVAYADGIIGRIEDICAGDAINETRKSILKGLSGIFSGDPASRIELNKIFDARNKNYDFIFFSMTSILMDAMILERCGPKAKIMNTDLKKEIADMAVNAGYFRIKNSLFLADECYKNLKRNAAAELAVDNMLIKMEKR